MNKFFEKIRWVLNHLITSLKNFVKNEDNAGFVFGAIGVIVLSQFFFPAMAMAKLGPIVQTLITLGVIIASGFMVRAMPTPDELDGKRPIRMSTNILTWMGIAAVFGAIAIAWYGNLGPRALLLVTGATFLYWINPVLSNAFANLFFLKKDKK